jgi:hypothetical protein
MLIHNFFYEVPVVLLMSRWWILNRTNIMHILTCHTDLLPNTRQKFIHLLDHQLIRVKKLITIFHNLIFLWKLLLEPFHRQLIQLLLNPTNQFLDFIYFVQNGSTLLLHDLNTYQQRIQLHIRQWLLPQALNNSIILIKLRSSCIYQLNDLVLTHLQLALPCIQRVFTFLYLITNLRFQLLIFFNVFMIQ